MFYSNKLPYFEKMSIKEQEQASTDLMWFLGIAMIGGVFLASLLLGGLRWQLGIQDYAAYFQEIASGKVPPDIAAYKILLTVSAVCTFVLPPLVFAHIRYSEAPATYLRLHRGFDLRLGGLIVCLVVGAYPLVALLSWLNSQLPISEALLEQGKANAGLKIALMQMNSPLDLVFNVFLLGVVAGLGEELFFRGVLQQIFSSLLKSPYLGIGATAILFSAMHFEWQSFIPITAMGVVLGFIFYWTGTIWANIVAHILFNSIQIIAIYGSPPADISDLADVTMPSWWSVLLGSLVFSGCLYYLRKKQA